jgi:hypothetical protein
MLYGLAQVSGDGGFAHRGVLIPLTAGAVLLASFVAWALRPHRRVTPLIDLRLLRVRSFSAAAGLPRESVPDASSVTRIMQQVGGSFGTAVLAVIPVGHSFQATFWWSVAFTALAVLPALTLPRRAAGSGMPG